MMSAAFRVVVVTIFLMDIQQGFRVVGLHREWCGCSGNSFVMKKGVYEEGIPAHLFAVGVDRRVALPGICHKEWGMTISMRG